MFFSNLFVEVLLKRYAYASRPSSTLLLVLPYSLSSLLVPINYSSLGTLLLYEVLINTLSLTGAKDIFYLVFVLTVDLERDKYTLNGLTVVVTVVL
jgi:hypothetical protein